MAQYEVVASSQDSTDSQETQEVYSQGSFEEIWDSLGRTFSNPDKLIQGFMIDELPFKVEFKDQQEPLDNLEVTYEQRKFKPSSPASSHPTTDLLQPLPVLNGTSTADNQLHERIVLPLILPNNNLPGPFDFRLDYEPNSEPITKATPWVYVADRQKLFVKMQSVCPIIFRIKGNPPPGSGVRGILMYKKPENYKDIVLRCPNHMNTSKDGSYQDHVMRCENPSTIYESCPKTSRLSLFIPLSAVNPLTGEGCFKELFKFTCFNSCVGGMNRRPTFLIFRLECGAICYGRAVVEVRVCASPGRDSTEKEPNPNQRNKPDNRNEPSSTTDNNSPTSTSLSPGPSPTTAYPPRASVLMSASKDPSSAPEPFHFPTVQEQSNKRPQYPVGTDGVVIKKIKKTFPTETIDDEIYTIRVRGKERFDILSKINEGLHLLDGVMAPEQPKQNRHGVESFQPDFTKIQPKLPFEIKKEKADSSQCHSASSQNSQENLSQLSRTSSNASSQSSSNHPEYSVLKVSMKRTISLKNAVVKEETLKQNRCERA